MGARAAAISGLVVGALVLAVAWLFDVSVSHVTLLAPVVVLVDVVRSDELQAHGSGDHALLEVSRGELEPVPEELDDKVVSRPVVGCEHGSQRI